VDTSGVQPGIDHSGEDALVACRVLVRLIGEEYPEGLALDEIARRWLDGVTEAELAALRRVEAVLNLPDDRGGGVNHAL
jgi:hypothetical protein